MVCVHCGRATQVVNSRRQKRTNQVWRRRQCRQCGAVFTTQETAQYGAAWAVRGRGDGLQPFSRDKLFLSLYKSCRHRPAAVAEAAALADTIISRLAALAENGAIERQAIVQTAAVALNRFDGAASAAYRAFHADFARSDQPRY